MEPSKTKVAILGGGAGSLAAAWALTNTAERAEAHDITVYQVGFRLGGKARSGRNADDHFRIEETGHHVWPGFYENSFRMMRACYEELDRAADAPIATWQDAFLKRNQVVVFCKLEGDVPPDDAWFPWTLTFPANYRTPGDGGDVAAPWTLFRLGIEWLWSLWRSSEEARTLQANVRNVGASHPSAASRSEGFFDLGIPPWIAGVLRRMSVMGAFAPLRHPLVGTAFPVHDLPEIAQGSALNRLIASIRNVVRSLPEDPTLHDAASHHILIWLLRKLLTVSASLLAPFVPTEPWAYKLSVSIQLAASTAVGLLSDGLLFHGLGSIDHVDWATWLRSHGADETTVGSGLVKAVYNMVFAYVNGEKDKGNLAAGTCVSGLLRLLLSYKGSAFWDLAAGSGDTLFAPLYLVLKKRGVKFKFFHRVAALYLSPDHQKVASIELVEQVRLKDGLYQPLLDVKGLAAWPNSPLYDQIEDGDELKAQGVDLESPYSAPWGGGRPVLLNMEEDYDRVVLGIPVGAIPYVAPELVRADRKFASMVANVGTVQTMAFQLWMTADRDELGMESFGGANERPLITAYVESVASLADVSQHLAREDWQSPVFPHSAAYFTGTLSQLGPLPPFTDHGFVTKQRSRVQTAARRFLENDVGRLWPLATKADGHGFKWEMVAAQHYQANVDPSALFVLSVAGSTHHRLRAGQSGFENLVLAGDWVRSSLNAGCFEAAVEGGFYAAEALLGERLDIFGRELCDAAPH